MIKRVLVFIVCLFILSCSSSPKTRDLSGEYVGPGGDTYGYSIQDHETEKTADISFTHKEKKYSCMVKYSTNVADVFGVSFKINLDEKTGEFYVTYKEVTAGCSLSDV